MMHKLNNPLRVFGWSIILLTFSFLINNILNFWYGFPGVDRFFANYNIFFENDKELNLKEFYKSWIQFLIYIIAILFSFVYVKIYNNIKIEKDSEYLSNFSAYIIRSCFWGVLIVGIVDMILSFLRVEDFLIPLFGENLGMNLGKSAFRGSFIHFPLIILAFIIGYLVERGWSTKPWILPAMLLGNIIIYIPGLIVLSLWVPEGKTLEYGLLPFIPGDLIKIILASILIPIIYTQIYNNKGNKG